MDHGYISRVAPLESIEQRLIPGRKLDLACKLFFDFRKEPVVEDDRLEEIICYTLLLLSHDVRPALVLILEVVETVLFASALQLIFVAFIGAQQILVNLLDEGSDSHLAVGVLVLGNVAVVERHH